MLLPKLKLQLEPSAVHTFCHTVVTKIIQLLSQSKIFFSLLVGLKILSNLFTAHNTRSGKLVPIVVNKLGIISPDSVESIV